ncbi:MAG: hypothetical protein OXI43_07015 [Candidatus Poribacteria bacterium]|nr:hypothetical protein [Candidatus Poribacteria bacterium]
MKRTYERLLFMAIGALISFTAYIIGCVSHTENIHAQSTGEKVKQSTAQQVSDEIVTRKIRVVNAEGETIVAVGDIGGDGSIFVNNKEGKRNVAIGSLGGGWLSIHPEDGGLGIIIRTGGNKPVMEFFNGSQTILLLGAAEDGGSVVTANNAGKIVAGMNATDEGGIVRTHNNAGKIVALMAAADGKGGIMGTLSNEGEPLVLIDSTKDGGLVKTYNNTGKSVSFMGANQNKSGIVQISNNKGERAVSMSVKGLGDRSFGGNIDIFNDAGIRVTRIEAALYGGFVQSWNNEGIRVTRIGAGPDGGFVGVSNDAGEWTGTLPPR